MFLATIPAVLYVDKFGRKTILIVGGIGMAVSHFIVAGYDTTHSFYSS
jgi:predicted MFS family arabinose efflux permease